MGCLALFSTLAVHFCPFDSFVYSRFSFFFYVFIFRYAICNAIWNGIRMVKWSCWKWKFYYFLHLMLSMLSPKTYVLFNAAMNDTIFISLMHYKINPEYDWNWNTNWEFLWCLWFNRSKNWRWNTTKSSGKLWLGINHCSNKLIYKYKKIMNKSSIRVDRMVSYVIWVATAFVRHIKTTHYIHIHFQLNTQFTHGNEC